MEDSIKIEGTKIVQGNHGFLLSKIKIRDLKKFTRYTSRILMGLDEDNKPIYNTYVQRKIDSGRVLKIADFLIDDPDAIFPTNIVLAVPEEAIEIIEENENALSFNIKPFVINELQTNVYITIVDGQHRIRGIEVALERVINEIDLLSNYIDHTTDSKLQKKYNRYSELKNKLLEFELIVTYILNATIDYQAMIFSTINRTQAKVSENLVQSLFGLTDKESPQKTALEITLALNSFQNSPFYKRIKIFGHNKNVVSGVNPVISQSTFVKSIVKLISQNAREAERDRYRSRKELVSGISKELCFRKYYVQNNDQKIINILYTYFKAVEETFLTNDGKSFWSTSQDVPENIIRTTVGFESLLSILPEILELIKEDERENKEKYKALLDKAKNLDFASKEIYPFTSITRKKLAEDLRNEIFS